MTLNVGLLSRSQGKKKRDLSSPGGKKALDDLAMSPRSSSMSLQSPAALSAGGRSAKQQRADMLLWNDLCTFVRDNFDEVANINAGKVADYIPALAVVNSDLFSISMCDVHGRMFSMGDSDISFCMQSTIKPFLYLMAQKLQGDECVHRHIGHEPSGQRGDAFALTEDNIPHNPMINSGAILSSSLILPDHEPSDRYEFMRQQLIVTAGGRAPGFDNTVFLSEQRHNDRNRALSYYMHEGGAFPPDSSIEDTLDLYAQACSVTVTTPLMSVMAATLANGGVCPTTQDLVYDYESVRNTLSLMLTCGMYDYSGRFCFEMGFPAKSGVSGAIMVVIPGVVGMVIWSPPLDKAGNSCRGIEVCRRLVQAFPQFHMFNLASRMTKVENDEDAGDATELRKHRFISAASTGDMERIEQMVDAGEVDVNAVDYDGRAALHLAAAEGHCSIVQYLVEHGADLSVKDRWGNTPQFEAYKSSQKSAGHAETSQYIDGKIGRTLSSQSPVTSVNPLHLSQVISQTEQTIRISEREPRNFRRSNSKSPRDPIWDN